MKNKKYYNVGENNPMYGTHRIGENSPTFGKSMKCTEKTKKKISNTLKGHRHSEESKRKMSKNSIGSKGYKHTKETKKKISETRKKWYKDMSKEEKVIYLDKWITAGHHARPSSLEISIRKILDSLNVKYLTDYHISKWFIDIYIPNRNLIIECNGNYWHNLPNRIKRDRELQEYAKENGYKLIWLWEDDIKEDPKLALRNGLERYRKRGELCIKSHSISQKVQ